MHDFLISLEDARSRIDQFLSAALPHLSRSRLQTLIKSGHILLNGALTKPGTKLQPADRVTVNEPAPTAIDTQAEAIDLQVIFEDADLIVINKPAGMVVHPGAGNWEHTLVNALLHHCENLSGIGGQLRPGIVHRLDKETSGCLIAAKNDLAHQQLQKQFADRKVLKIYWALARGLFRSKTGVIDAPIGRHKVHRQKMTVLEHGRPAKTSYKVLREIYKHSLVECTLHTGRTHQIRVHLKHLGHPILGDKVYGARDPHPRQMLHAWKLGFTHPRTGQWLEFESPMPQDFRSLLQQ